MIELERVGAMAKRHGLLFVVDASQTAGVWPIDVEKMQIDVLCFTGHKSLLGPQGTGGMYVREGVAYPSAALRRSGIDTYNEKHPAEMPTALDAGDSERARYRRAGRCPVMDRKDRHGPDQAEGVVPDEKVL